MKIAITGTGGFIGGHLQKYFEDIGHEVIGYDRKSNQYIKDFTIEEDIEFVIHLAADADVRRSIEHPEEYWINNVEPTTKIQKLCHKMNIPLMYASSSCIHNWWLSPYGVSKKVNEETAYPGQVALRFTTVYGDGARESMLIGKLINGRVKYLTTHVRDFIHVNDVLTAIKAIMEKMLISDAFDDDSYINVDSYIKVEAAYDIGTGKGNIVEDLGALAGWEGIEVINGALCEAQDNTADNSALRKLGWEPTIDVEEYIVSKTIPH